MDLRKMENGNGVAAMQCNLFARGNLINRILTWNVSEGPIRSFQPLSRLSWVNLHKIEQLRQPHGDGWPICSY
jgi:hypothetical protein